jgi:hypothetical protein
VHGCLLDLGQGFRFLYCHRRFDGEHPQVVTDGALRGQQGLYTIADCCRLAILFANDLLCGRGLKEVGEVWTGWGKCLVNPLSRGVIGV